VTLCEEPFEKDKLKAWGDCRVAQGFSGKGEPSAPRAGQLQFDVSGGSATDFQREQPRREKNCAKVGADQAAPSMSRTAPKYAASRRQASSLCQSKKSS
jgi:hypothetical protein